MFHWWRKWQDRKRLALEDARLLIARFGVRASQEANRRMIEMQDGAVFDLNRPACHWRRVLSLTRRLLPYDEVEAIALPSPRDTDLPIAS
jgi:hypothetical protein